MAHASTLTHTPDEREQFAAQYSQLPGKDSLDSPTNPFASGSEIASNFSPIEEYEEPIPEDESLGPNDLHVKPTSRHPYGRTQTAPAGSSNNNNAIDHSSARRHSRINLLTPPNATASPTLICLHGSNDSCMRSWLGMIEVLYKQGSTILLYDRPPASSTTGGADLKPHRAVSELCSYLYSADLRGPFVFIAHSYGAAIARLFLQQKPHLVAGMVLVETGQETALAPSTEEEQYRRQILGDAPLAVVRGNCMRAKQDEWVREAAAASTPQQKARLEPQRLMLEQWEAEDERLKRKQLGLSRNSHFCQVPDVGHHPIRDAPEAVIQEVRWVIGQLATSGAALGLQGVAANGIGGGGGSGGGFGGGGAGPKMGHSRPGMRRNLSSASAGLTRGFSTRLADGIQRTFSKRARA